MQRSNKSILLTLIIAFCLLSGCSDDDNIEDSPDWSGSIQVSIEYTGSRNVDAFHKIYVGLWYDQYSGSALMSDSISSPLDTVSFTVINKLCFVGAFLDVDGFGSEVLTENDIGEIYHNYSFFEPGTPLLMTDAQNSHDIGIVFDDSFVYTPIDLTGTWTDSITYNADPDNPNQLALLMTQSGNIITGRCFETNMGVFVDLIILDGIVDINKLSFKIDEMQYSNDPAEYRNFTGTIVGDTISGTFASESDIDENGTWSVIRQ